MDLLKPGEPNFVLTQEDNERVVTDSFVFTKGARAVDTSWKTVVAKYAQPSVGRSIGQIVNSFGPYLLLWVAMYFTRSISWWLTIGLAVLAAGFLVRIFIIQHDCGHGSFFRSREANDVLGFIAGVLTLTPYYLWRWEHAVHHATAGDLDRRGLGDIWTWTVKEYRAAPRAMQIGYRVWRNPLVLFTVAPLLVFLVRQRFEWAKATKREKYSVYWTNLALLAVAATLSWIYGIKSYLLIQLTTTAVGSSLGIWLFYVQHQFEGVYWDRHGNWDYTTAALRGSSFYKLPKVLQWFSGNIGFHHIHHLSPAIPNYNLEKCQKAEPLFQTVPPVTLRSSFKAFHFNLWDEERNRLISFRELDRNVSTG